MIGQAKQATAGAEMDPRVTATSIGATRALHVDASGPTTFRDTMKATSSEMVEDAKPSRLNQAKLPVQVRLASANQAPRSPGTTLPTSHLSEGLPGKEVAIESGFGSVQKTLDQKQPAAQTASQEKGPPSLPALTKVLPSLLNSTAAEATTPSKARKAAREKKEVPAGTSQSVRRHKDSGADLGAGAGIPDGSAESTAAKPELDLRSQQQVVFGRGDDPASIAKSEKTTVASQSHAPATKEASVEVAGLLPTPVHQSEETQAKSVRTTETISGETASSASLVLEEPSRVSSVAVNTKEHVSPNADGVGPRGVHVVSQAGESLPPSRSAASTSSVTMPSSLPGSSALVAGEQPVMKTMQATAHVLEVGVGDSTHGWLRVRAELGNTGEVIASVVAGTAGAAEKLHKEIPDMSAYLRSEQVGISSLVVHATTKASETFERTVGMSAGTGSDTNSHSDRRRGTYGSEEARKPDDFGDWAGSPESSPDLSSSLSGLATHSVTTRDGSGGWLNVRV